MTQEVERSHLGDTEGARDPAFGLVRILEASQQIEEIQKNSWFQ